MSKAAAQIVTGSISGSVVDSTGSVIAARSPRRVQLALRLNF